MDSVPVKQPDDTIVAYLDKLNDATSLAISKKLELESTSNVGWLKILLQFCTSFLKVYFAKKMYRRGVDGFITARLAAIHSLVSNVKLWEYQMRKKEGNKILPPHTLEEIQHLRNKYNA
jgi:hypothetical protein